MKKTSSGKTVQDHTRYPRDTTQMAPTSNADTVCFLMELLKSQRLSLKDLSIHHRMNRDLVLTAVKVDGNDLLFAAQTLYHDKEILLAALDSISRVATDQRRISKFLGYQGFPREFLGNVEVVVAALKADVLERNEVCFIAASLFENRTVVLAYASSKISDLSTLSPLFLNDKEVVMAAVTSDAYLNLKYAHSSLRDDEEVVLAAVEDCGDALQFASERLQAHRGIVLAAVSNDYFVVDGCPLAAAHTSLRDDDEVVLAAVSQCARSIEWASERLRHDRSIVLAAVFHSPDALAFAPVNYRDDFDVVLAAIGEPGDGRTSNFPSIIDFVSERLKHNRVVVLAALSRMGWDLQYVPEPLRSDREVVLKAILSNGLALKFAPTRFLDDTQIVHCAVHSVSTKQKYLIFLEDAEELRNHRGVVLEAVSANSENIEYMDDEFRSDREIMLAAIASSKNGSPYYGASIGLRNDFHFARAAVIRGVDIEKLADKEFYHDGELKRISRHAKRSNRLWECVRVYVQRRRTIFFWMKVVAESLGAAHFDETGLPVLVGRDAKRQRIDFEDMGVRALA